MKWFFLILLILVPTALATTPGPLSVLDLSYEDGEVVLRDKVDGFGYYPDRKTEFGDATVEIKSEGQVLYSTSFVPPFVEYAHAQTEHTDFGGVLDVDSFVLVVPSFAHEDEIVVSGRGYSHAYDVSEGGSILLPLLLILSLITILIVLMFRISRR